MGTKTKAMFEYESEKNKTGLDPNVAYPFVHRGDINKYMFETSSVQMFALDGTTSTGVQRIVIVVSRSRLPSQYIEFDYEMWIKPYGVVHFPSLVPLRLEFDCQGEKVGLVTERGTIRWDFAYFGLRVSSQYDPSATPRLP